MQGWSQGDQGGRLRCHMDKNPVKQGKVLVARNQRQDKEEGTHIKTSFLWHSVSLMKKNLEGQGEGRGTK